METSHHIYDNKTMDTSHKRYKTRTSLSLPLYAVQGQVTTTNVNHNKDIIGIHTPNKKKNKLKYHIIQMIQISFQKIRNQ